MGVLIKGMEMPKEIEPALVIDFCEGLGGKRYARFYHYRYGGLTDWHEVLEVPGPHGRLIDADEIARYKEQILVDADKIDPEIRYVVDTKYIKEAPTIIPAEEGK